MKTFLSIVWALVIATSFTSCDNVDLEPFGQDTTSVVTSMTYQGESSLINIGVTYENGRPSRIENMANGYKQIATFEYNLINRTIRKNIEQFDPSDPINTMHKFHVIYLFSPDSLLTESVKYYTYSDGTKNLTSKEKSVYSYNGNSRKLINITRYGTDDENQPYRLPHSKTTVTWQGDSITSAVKEIRTEEGGWAASEEWTFRSTTEPNVFIKFPVAVLLNLDWDQGFVFSELHFFTPYNFSYAKWSPEYTNVEYNYTTIIDEFGALTSLKRTAAPTSEWPDGDINVVWDHNVN